ncbi:MAG: hypothetical protein AB8F65_15935 [Woeseiaceae bacterium]
MNRDDKAVSEERLDAYLQGNEKAVSGYPDSAAMPPASLDAKILAAASDAVSVPVAAASPRYRGFAVAATVVLTAGLVIVMRSDPSMERVPVDRNIALEATAETPSNASSEVMPSPASPGAELALGAIHEADEDTEGRFELEDSAREKRSGVENLRSREEDALASKRLAMMAPSADNSLAIDEEVEQAFGVTMPAMRRAVIDESQQRLVMIREAAERQDMEKARALLLMFRTDYPNYPLSELKKQLPEVLFDDPPE